MRLTRLKRQNKSAPASEQSPGHPRPQQHPPGLAGQDARAARSANQGQTRQPQNAARHPHRRAHARPQAKAPPRPPPKTSRGDTQARVAERATAQMATEEGEDAEGETSQSTLLYYRGPPFQPPEDTRTKIPDVFEAIARPNHHNDVSCRPGDENAFFSTAQWGWVKPRGETAGFPCDSLLKRSYSCALAQMAICCMALWIIRACVRKLYFLSALLDHSTCGVQGLNSKVLSATPSHQV